MSVQVASDGERGIANVENGLFAEIVYYLHRNFLLQRIPGNLCFVGGGGGVGCVDGGNREVVLRHRSRGLLVKV